MPEHPILVTPALVTKECLKSLTTALGPLLWLAIHADDRGAVQGSISIKALGDAWACSPSTVKTVLRRLRSGGFIESEVRREGLKIRLLPGRGLNFNLPDVGGGAENNPSQPATVPGVDKNLAVAAATSSPEDFYKRDRFRLLLEAYRTACQEKGWKPFVTQDDRDIILSYLRAHPAVTADEILRQLRNFSVVVNREGFTLGDFAGFLAANADENSLGGVINE